VYWRHAMQRRQYLSRPSTSLAGGFAPGWMALDFDIFKATTALEHLNPSGCACWQFGQHSRCNSLTGDANINCRWLAWFGFIPLPPPICLGLVDQANFDDFRSVTQR
jgi:hypothetical protein